MAGIFSVGPSTKWIPTVNQYIMTTFIRAYRVVDPTLAGLGLLRGTLALCWRRIALLAILVRWSIPKRHPSSQSVLFYYSLHTHGTENEPG